MHHARHRSTVEIDATGCGQVSFEAIQIEDRAIEIAASVAGPSAVAAAGLTKSDLFPCDSLFSVQPLQS
jgi:hypothetical protein